MNNKRGLQKIFKLAKTLSKWQFSAQTHDDSNSRYRVLYKLIGSLQKVTL